MEQKYSEAPGSILCTLSAVQKEQLFVTARIPKDHYCWILWSTQVSQKEIAETQLRNRGIKERRVKTQELFKKNERKRQPYTKLFILNPDN